MHTSKSSSPLHPVGRHPLDKVRSCLFCPVEHKPFQCSSISCGYSLVRPENGCWVCLQWQVNKFLGVIEDVSYLHSFQQITGAEYLTGKKKAALTTMIRYQYACSSKCLLYINRIGVFCASCRIKIVLKCANLYLANLPIEFYCYLVPVACGDGRLSKRTTQDCSTEKDQQRLHH